MAKKCKLCFPQRKERRKDPFIFRRTTAAAAAAFYTEITGLLNTVVSLAGAARDMDSHVCNLVTKTWRLVYQRTYLNERSLNHMKWKQIAISPSRRQSLAQCHLSPLPCALNFSTANCLCALCSALSIRPEWRDRFSIEWQMNSPLSDSERRGHISRPYPNNVYSEKLYRDRLKLVHQVWWTLFLLLLNTSASSCLQHSRYLVHRL